MSDLVSKLSEKLKALGIMMASAESCTGGLIAKLMTDRAGSSAVFERGFVTYSNEAKTELLNVASDVIETHGAVSENVAKAMALGALDNSRAHCAISCTGIAGPDGGTDEKPVGLVYIGTALKDGQADVFKHVFEGNRDDIRNATADAAIQHLLDLLDNSK